MNGGRIVGRWKTAKRWCGRVGLAMVMAVVGVSVFGWNWERSEQRAFAALNLEDRKSVV